MECSDVRDNLVALVDGELREADAKAVQAHMAECASCQAELRGIERLMRAAGQDVARRSTSMAPSVWAEVDREIMFGLVDQVSALSAEVKALRAELASTQRADEHDDALDVENMSEEAPIIRIAHAIVQGAIRQKASQIHIEPKQKGVRVRYLVDGAFVEAMTVPKHIQNQLIARFKIMAGLNIAERRVPQEGRIPIKADLKDYELEVLCELIEFGEYIAVHIVEKPQASLSVGEIVGDDLRWKAEVQIGQAQRISQDASGVVEQDLIDAVNEASHELYLALDRGDVADIKAQLGLSITSLQVLAQAFYEERTKPNVDRYARLASISAVLNTPSPEIENLRRTTKVNVGEGRQSEKAVITTHDDVKEGGDPWSFAIS